MKSLLQGFSLRFTTGLSLPKSCVKSLKLFSKIALWNKSFYFSSTLTGSLALSFVSSADEFAPLIGIRLVESLRVREASILGKEWMEFDLAMLFLRLAIEILFR
jgi:hypothetical protein